MYLGAVGPAKTSGSNVPLVFNFTNKNKKAALLLKIIKNEYSYSNASQGTRNEQDNVGLISKDSYIPKIYQ